MAGRLEGKNVIVTAAAQGIGRATAMALAREGAAVLATDINTELLGELEARNGSQTSQARHGRCRRGRQAGRRQSTLDALINIVAGYVHHGTITAARRMISTSR